MKKIILLFLIVLIAGLFITSRKINRGQLSSKTGIPPTTYDLPTTTLFFAGDIMLSRNVAAKIYAADDYTLPFKNVASESQAADIAFANLESPFNDTGDRSVEGSLVFNADPRSVAGLKFAGFDILSTANNHSMDQGSIGLIETQNVLTTVGILPVGTGNDCREGKIITRNNITFGFLAYSYTAYNTGGSDSPYPQVCDANDLQGLKKDIQNLRPSVDVLVVSTHMGTEYTRNPNASQINFAHTAIDAGADLIIGNHPHWVQTIEQYNGKWIFYALGNFVFDQMWSTETREGLTATVTFKDKTLDKIVLKPVIIDNFCCPRWADELESEAILSKISLNSPILFNAGD
ncbi:MAG: CapA family protein [Candidatus Doudnabacteria bacterium]|nr:CapA family protein [Candidatus Doudnabacteria bacterium]